MKQGLKSGLLWTFSIIFTFLVAYWQRSTGPSYPVKSKIEINGSEITNRLITTYGGEDDAEVRIEIPDSGFTGIMKYRRYRSHDEWKEIAMVRDGDFLVTNIPHQPPAGKVDYHIYIKKDGLEIPLTEEPVRKPGEPLSSMPAISLPFFICSNAARSSRRSMS